MGVLLPLQPGDPTKSPAAILRGAPFGHSSPAREKFSSLSWEYCYPLPAGFVVLKCEIECTSRTREYCPPSFPSGIPPPLGKRAVLLKCGIYFSSFLIKFESRIEIIERRTVFTERRSLYPTENTFGGDPDGERKATRRARRPCLLNVSSSLRGRKSLPHRKFFRRGPRIAATCKRRLCHRIMTRALPSSPAS